MFKRLVRAGFYGTILLIGFCGLTWVWLSFTTVSAADLPALKNGDIIFQNSQSPQSLAILLASHSPYTHMGLIEIDSAGRPWVVEAAGPVRSTPLDAWIASGLGRRITIKRLTGLSADQARAILAQAHRYDGRPYDIFFLPDEDRIYCSELVALAFSKGANIAIGKEQKVRELDLDNFAVRKLIANRWQRYPLCKPSSDYSFESCFDKILGQTLVTPASIADDAKLSLVFSNFGLLQ